MLEHARTSWIGVVNAPLRFAYTHTLVDPPSITYHPLWREGTRRMVDSNGRKTKRPLYSRRTISTVAVDHAFT